MFENIMYPNKLNTFSKVEIHNIFNMFDILRKINIHLLAHYINMSGLFSYDTANIIRNIVLISYPL